MSTRNSDTKELPVAREIRRTRTLGNWNTAVLAGTAILAILALVVGIAIIVDLKHDLNDVADRQAKQLEGDRQERLKDERIRAAQDKARIKGLEEVQKLVSILDDKNTQPPQQQSAPQPVVIVVDEEGDTVVVSTPQPTTSPSGRPRKRPAPTPQPTPKPTSTPTPTLDPDDLLCGITGSCSDGQDGLLPGVLG
jgi:cell division septation protein DedD